MSNDNLPIEITVAEVAARRQAGEKLILLDVREPAEFEAAHIDGSEHIPLGQIPMHIEAMLAERPEAEIICYCHHGRRSLTAADFLRRAGCTRARSLAGGIDAWSCEVDGSIPRY